MARAHPIAFGYARCMTGYRDDIEAAQARIAQLEAEVADLRRELAREPATKARLVELRAHRADAVAELARVEQSARSWRSVAMALGLVGAIGFVGTIASLGHEGHPINAAALSLLVVASMVLVVDWIGGSRRRERARAVEEVDRAIAKVLEPTVRARVAEPGVRVGSIAEEEPNDAEARAESARSVGR